ncbi:MAG: hypothetical protein A3B91_02200 [Candidatus Yanofskybacteria bacterium RIFCSPHIGHO2_02_FULL_41_29]|uniref:UVR domain-containing protein n=1 Tax=Candidatus Yanofskybacteria bacterium RIFCSPHIGHO2_01_FULL_41_53 TaxID=1802663 RepID=A0A1F8EG11_9BACT|nr:MAG: hypothetical protein A2650_04925 [Candidatus Yanofskybacteria bacterium RIFCSPHIGHO2_01_FULL_41_53]OGN12337.1 MAG: hypothetical protein A3B91_02200 [Candidatus Yanofskybacteria bacterium RIFCSPHIGHO2_02_FULL_41_29]OGN17704.1 MAG: hypothetical protein A3F48_00495 [Candidatus Yanofskybacteria bacterium RIFCSPHIGHO2_12_FULL_41_9]OGN22010.1 MAG: hypothetical protein A2916_04265 [Candidatus Yanofskybacteria bacterium RIFCSPLOWO2_01_FULL_41_67]OGN28900.1 MAG: hypothetical protein A3H54_02025 
MYWANFLHIYQPPTQKEIWVRRITKESYRKIFSGFLNISQCRLTLNINSVLCELLEKWGGEDVIKDIRELLKQGKLELTGSAKYHAFLPFMPEEEIKRQIKLDEEGLDKYFGKYWNKKGFFSPEMAYSDKVAKVAKELGYEWILVDEMGFPPDRKYRQDMIYQIPSAGNIDVFFRERSLSFIVLSAQIGTMPAIVRYLGDRLNKNEYAVTAMDGETFGHHRPGMEQFLFDLLSDEKIKTVAISDLAELFKNREDIQPRPSTWAVTEDDMKRNEPYARWNRKDNEIQRYQWELTDLAVNVAERTPDNEVLRSALDRAIHSDQYWWASARPWWSLEMIERGAYELRQIILSSPKSTDEEKTRAGEYYKNILYKGFDWQREGKVDEIARQEDEDVLGRLHGKGKLFITKAEYGQMVETLKEQVQSASKDGDYHRAAMLKDRIQELTEEMDETSL